MKNVMELDNGFGRCVRDHKVMVEKKKRIDNRAVIRHVHSASKGSLLDTSNFTKLSQERFKKYVYILLT